MEKVLRLYLNGDTVEVYVDGEASTLVRGVTATQALNIAKKFTSKYDKVTLADDYYEAFIELKKGSDNPLVNTYYPEDYVDMEKKYGLYEESDEAEQVDLENEKWNNYWGDYNQCGIRIDY